jgi:hypothetical protein
MEPLSQQRSPWTNISVDFIIGLPVSCQKCHAMPYYAILIIIHWYTKQVHYFSCYEAYYLKLSQQASSIHNILHISLLMLYVSNGCTALNILPPIEIDAEEEYKFEEII